MVNIKLFSFNGLFYLKGIWLKKKRTKILFVDFIWRTKIKERKNCSRHSDCSCKFHCRRVITCQSILDEIVRAAKNKCFKIGRPNLWKGKKREFSLEWKILENARGIRFLSSSSSFLFKSSFQLGILGNRPIKPVCRNENAENNKLSGGAEKYWLSK